MDKCELQEIFNSISHMLNFQKSTKRSTANEIYWLVKDLKKENDKLRFVNNVLHGKNISYCKQLREVQNKLDDVKYIDRIKKNFDNIYKTVKHENNELNLVIIGLKRELDYYKTKMKSIRTN